MSVRCPELTFLLCSVSEPHVLSYWLDVCKPGGIVVFTHKTSIWDEWEKEQVKKGRKAIYRPLPHNHIKRQHFRSDSNWKRDGGRGCGFWIRPYRICRPSPPTTTRRKWQRSTFTERIRRRAPVNGIDSGSSWTIDE